MSELKTRSENKIFGSLPKSRNALTPLLPVELNELFGELVREGYAEQDVLLALYQALAEHDGVVLLGIAYAPRQRLGLGYRSRRWSPVSATC